MSDVKLDEKAEAKPAINLGDVYISQIPKDGGKAKPIAAMGADSNLYEVKAGDK